MSTIKHWDEVAYFDKEQAMEAEITELREALRVAKWQNSANMGTCKNIITGLTNERDALASKLSALENQEPVAQWHKNDDGSVFFDEDPPTEYERSIGWMSLYAAPVAPVDTEIIHKNELQIRVEQALDRLLPPAQPKMVTPYISQEHFDRAFPDAPITQPKDHEIAKLVNDLTQIATIYHNHQSLRQRISIRVLETVKAAKPLTKEQVQPAQLDCDCGRTHKLTAYGWASNDPAREKLIGCVQHDCDECKARQSNAERVKPNCKECAKWSQERADNKGWIDGVSKGNEIIRRLAEAEIKKGQQ